MKVRELFVLVVAVLVGFGSAVYLDSNLGGMLVQIGYLILAKHFKWL